MATPSRRPRQPLPKTEGNAVTYADIAAKAGVSRMTVSLALRNHPDVSKATAERIRQIADEMGYRPDPEINRLMSYLRSSREVRPETVVAFLDPWPRDPKIPDRYHLDCLLSGVRARCAQNGVIVDVLWLKEPGMTQRRMNNILFTRGIRGVLVPPLPQGRGHLSFEWDKFACVAMDDVMKPDLHRVTANEYGNAMTALRRLKKLKYRRIGFVENRFLEEKVNHAFSAAVYWHHAQVKASERVPPLIVDKVTPALLGEYVAKRKPEVLLGMMSEKIVLDAGLRIPEDVALASLYTTRTDGTLAGIHPMTSMVGSAAVDLLLGQLMRNEKGVPAHFKHTQISGVWQDGTTAPGL